jgi:hypothetical protein
LTHPRLAVTHPGLAAFLAASLAAMTGCAGEQTPREELGTYASTERILYVGTFYDQRGAGPAVSSSAPQAEEPAPAVNRQRDVRVPVSEVRSVFADALARAGLFPRVVNPPAAFTGDTPDAMLTRAQQSSDYLLLAEVTQLHIKSVGYSGNATFSIPLDLLFAPITFATYVSTAGNIYLFSGGLMACWTAEVVLTMSVTLIDVSTGQVAHTIRLEERVQAPYDGTDAFGSFWDPTDDWIDLGRRLGEVALHNATVDLAARLDQVLDRER